LPICSGRVRRRGPRRSSGPSPKKVLIIGLTTVVVFGGGGYVSYTAVQNANRPPEEQPLTLTELANMFGGGDPFAPDPKADAAKARAAQALRKQALAASREDRRKLDPVVIPTEAPGGNGFDPKAFPPGSNPDPGSNKAIGK